MLSLLKHFSKAPQFVFATVKIITNNCLADYIAHAHFPLDGVLPVEGHHPPAMDLLATHILAIELLPVKSRQ